MNTPILSVTKNLSSSVISKGYVPRLLEKMGFGHIDLSFMVLLKNNEMNQKHELIISIDYSVMHHGTIPSLPLSSAVSMT